MQVMRSTSPCSSAESSTTRADRATVFALPKFAFFTARLRACFSSFWSRPPSCPSGTSTRTHATLALADASDGAAARVDRPIAIRAAHFMTRRMGAP